MLSLPTTFIFDADGRQRNAALLEYKLQTCADAPPIDVHFIQMWVLPDSLPACRGPTIAYMGLSADRLTGAH